MLAAFATCEVKSRLNLLISNSSVIVDGSTEWAEKIYVQEQPKYAIHPSNTYSTESPVTDGKHVFCYFATIGKIAAVSLKGKLAWTVNIGAFPSGNGFGTGSSLALLEDTLFIQCDNDKDSFVVALDTATGKEKWKRKRSSRTSWSSPYIWKHEKRTDLVICGSGTVTGYDPATGKTNWQLTNTRSAFTASPASDGKYIFLGNSGPFRQGPLIAIGPEITGEPRLDTSKLPKGVIWAKLRGGPGMSSPVASGNYIYVCSRGFLSCYNTKTGQEAYKSRLPSSKSIAASMWADDKHVFLMDESGKAYVVKAGPEFKIVGENDLDDLFWSTPAVTKGTLLLAEPTSSIASRCRFGSSAPLAISLVIRAWPHLIWAVARYRQNSSLNLMFWNLIDQSAVPCIII